MRTIRMALSTLSSLFPTFSAAGEINHTQAFVQSMQPFRMLVYLLSPFGVLTIPGVIALRLPPVSLY